MTVSSGTGPAEVRVFVRMLVDALRDEVSKRGVTVLSATFYGPEEAPSSVALRLLGEDRDIADLIGTHALVMRSSERGKRDRKRWHAGVSCEEWNAPHPVSLDARDVVFETCRASGAGGQHVNKTESAVRAVHRKSGLSVRIESERSQNQNKRRALEELNQMFAHEAEREIAKAKSARRYRSIRVERGAPVVTWRMQDGHLVPKR
jgi:putative peptide chain release factor H